MKKTSKPFHAFLTHNWSKNQDGYNNHEIVSKVNRELQSYGLKTWFDEERMRGSIQKMMADGIEQSDVVVVFITQTYIDKVNEGDAKDNCNFEFGMATRRLGTKCMIPVCMEKRLQNPNSWTGIVGGCLGGNLYVDMTDHFKEETFKQKCAELRNMILDTIGENVSRYGGPVLGLAPAEPQSSEKCSLCSCLEGLMGSEEKSLVVESGVGGEMQNEGTRHRPPLEKVDKTYQGHTKTVFSLAVLDSQCFISGSGDNNIKLWNKDKEAALRTYQGHTGAVTSLAVLDSQCFISGSDDMNIKLWNID